VIKAPPTGGFEASLEGMMQISFNRDPANGLNIRGYSSIRVAPPPDPLFLGCQQAFLGELPLCISIPLEAILRIIENRKQYGGTYGRIVCVVQAAVTNLTGL
jgi:hypothetical protein